ncbi:MAG TPA: hypothetical protein VMR65_07585 [Candidatus Sulfotelmatobacter sp.]|jgi:hypothetical protein|nr:hypothetical protein [Candidatus Sulfotelmatobacter sp.]
MTDDKPLKSAYELAMERLKAKDREEGIEDRPLTPAQKAKIAELRRDAQAKLAEIEILHKKALAEAGGDPEALKKLEEHYQTDRARAESRLEAAIAKVKG